MRLFVNGCSFSYGGSIFPLYDENNQLINFNSESVINQKRLNSVWAKHLGNYLNAESVINLSLCSSSNDRILRSTIDFIENLKNSDDLFVVIQWSNPDRYEFYDDLYGGWFEVTGSNSWLFVPDKNNFNFNKIERKIISEKIEIFYKNFYSEHQFVMRSLNYFMLLAEYLNSKNIKYVFCLLSYGIFDKFNHNSLLKNKIQHISSLYNWLQGNMGSSTLSNGLQDSMFTDTGHPNFHGHEQIAINMHKYIINNIK